MARPLTADELRALNEQCRKSLKGGDALFAELCRSTGLGVRTKDGAAAMLIQPSGGYVAAQDMLARLGRDAGVQPQPPTVGPMEQALACVRLMEHGIPGQAQRVLSRLMLEFPVLLHPRIVWEVDPRDDPEDPPASEPRPLLAVLLRHPHATLPSTAPELRQARDVRQFCEHGAVIAALRAKCPHLLDHGMPDSVELGRRVKWKPEIYGKDLGTLMQSGEWASFGLVAGLLALDRIRAEAGFKRCELALSEPSRIGIRSMMRECLKESWLGSDHPQAQLAIEEMASAAARNPELNLHALVESEVAWDLAHYLFRDHGTPADVPARLDRLSHLLQHLRMVDSPRQAEGVFLRALFPMRGEFMGPNVDKQCTDTNVAFAVLSRFVNAGFRIDVIHERVFNNCSNSPWTVALEILTTQCSMNDVIERRAVPDEVAVAAPARMRRGAL